MIFEPKDPPRRFTIGNDKRIEIKDCGRVALQADEQLTFTTPSGGEYDLVRKDWGFYATPSLNARLRDFGLRAVLVKNGIGRYFVLLVENGSEASFEKYMEDEKMIVITWLDDTEVLGRLERKVRER